MSRAPMGINATCCFWGVDEPRVISMGANDSYNNILGDNGTGRVSSGVVLQGTTHQKNKTIEHKY